VDLTPYLVWFKYLHVVGAFMFVAGHGVSMAVAFRLRAERDASRMLALLDLSAWSLAMAGIGLLVILVSGIVSGIVGGYFGTAWIWIALVLLIVVGGLMTPIAGTYFSRVRLALGQRTRNLKATDPDPAPLPLEEVVALAQSRRPELSAAIGVGGFLVILWLMIFKPF
jgi:MFS family permease